MTYDRAALLNFYCDAFIPDPESGYILMNPPGRDAKYYTVGASLEGVLIASALDGATTRRRGIGSVPLSLGVRPAHRDGWARAAILDWDAGGIVGGTRALAVLARYGLWGFVQLSTSVNSDGEIQHDGGHVYCPTEQPLPAELLRDIALRIQAEADVKGEAYPDEKRLRLPLMLHLRAPGGPRRFPLLLPTGELVDAGDAWAALAHLREVWRPNTAEQISAALEALPKLSAKKPAKRHKSKVEPKNEQSVIGWYNDNYGLRDLLEDAGVAGAKRLQVVCCPWHDDKHPSLAIFTHRDGHEVAHCFSASSGCWAAEGPFIDAFNIYAKNTTPSDAVRELAEAHGFKQTRKLEVERTPESDLPPRRTLGEHQALITTAREHLSEALSAAANRAGHVTILQATPGLGKTHAAAELANRAHADGKNVAIVVFSHDLALSEWVPRISRAFVWQSRESICTCYERDYLSAVTRLGYALPECQKDCPYSRQYMERNGRITIYQHNHLHLNHGEILEGADIVIVDESPLPALLEEETRTQDELRLLANRRTADGQADPAAPLIRALYAVGHTHKLCSPSLRGPALLEALSAELPVSLDEALAAARGSFLAHERLRADGITGPEHLPPLFFGRMLRALAHDAQPHTPNTLLAWDGTHWAWFKPHTLLGACVGKITAPAVLVLDGSANAMITKRLYAPWPVDVVTIDAPISPAVRVVQCPVTTSTRRLVQDQKTLDSVTRSVMTVCNHLGTTVDGGISYLAIEKHLEAELGGQWLHYGGQRGNNTLKDARTLAVIASPTAPPDAIERKALALWADDTQPIACAWQCIGKGNYTADDARLEAMNQLHGIEELSQAAHRCRPILSTEPTTLLIFSPWNIDDIGLVPHAVIRQLPHGNSTESAESVTRYKQRMDHLAIFQSPLSIKQTSTPTIEKVPSVTSAATSTQLATSTPSMAGFEKRRSDAPSRPPLIAADDPWIVLQAQLAQQARAAGDFERAAFYQKHVDRVVGGTP